jgi:hypothetical protein
VSNLRDKTEETSSPSELNPLTNPLLERNLGRWAKVYLSTPPEKREQAVSTLLQELKRESGAGDEAQPARRYFARDARFQTTVCSVCLRQNPFGHKFCSRCGQPLDLAQPGAMKPTVTAPGAAGAGVGEGGVTQSGARESDPARNAAARLFIGVQPQFANDVRWLRDRTFSGLGGFEAPPRRRWRYLLGAAVLVLAGFAYVRWAQVVTTPVTPTTATHVSAPVLQAPGVSAPTSQLPPNSPPSGVQSRAETVISVSKSSELPNASATSKAQERTDVPVGVQPTAQKSPLLGATGKYQRGTALESDASDLRLAQRYLSGSMGARDSAEAAKLLWKAVGKQDATAAVLLSDLYLRGDGVPRSCDQARLLLVAAAKRGAPQAGQQLRNLESQGCR